MSDNMKSGSLTWGEIMDLEDEKQKLTDTLPGASNNNCCQKNQHSQSPMQQKPKTSEQSEGAHQDNNPAPKQKEIGNLATDQRGKGACQENYNQVPHQKKVGGHQTPYQRGGGATRLLTNRRTEATRPLIQGEEEATRAKGAAKTTTTKHPTNRGISKFLPNCMGMQV